LTTNFEVVTRTCETKTFLQHIWKPTHDYLRLKPLHLTKYFEVVTQLSLIKTFTFDNQC